VPTGAEPWHVLSVLLALLELARLGECLLRQPIPFGPVEINAAERPSWMAATMIGDAPAPTDERPTVPTPDMETPTVLMPHFDPPHDTAGAAA